MFDKIFGKKTTCGNCGSSFREMERLPCNKCGSMARSIQRFTEENRKSADKAS